MSNETKAQLAWFTWNAGSRRYEVEVMGLIVASLKTIAQVKAFCAMHNTVEAFCD